MDIEGRTVHLTPQEFKGTVLITNPFEATDTNLLVLDQALDTIERYIDIRNTVDGEIRTIENPEASKEIAKILKTRSLMRSITQRIFANELKDLPKGRSPYE
jgi:hypothetical protein